VIQHHSLAVSRSRRKNAGTGQLGGDHNHPPTGFDAWKFASRRA